MITSPVAAEADAKEAKLGVYVTAIHSLDVAGSIYAMDLYVWWVSRGRNIDPVSDLQIVNGRSWQVRSVNTCSLPDGRHYTAAFVSATINHN